MRVVAALFEVSSRRERRSTNFFWRFALLCFVLLGSARVLATVQQVADIALASSGPGGASGGSGTVLGAIACSCLRLVDGGLRRAGPCEIPASSPPQSSL